MNHDLEKRIIAIDALRGLAALAVMTVHALGSAKNIYPEYINYIIKNGGLGVQLFFVISGFSMFLTLSKSMSIESKDIFNFYIRRIFRIMPLFLFVLLFSFIFKNYPLYTASGPVIENFLAHFFIIDSFNPYWMSNGIIGVEWTISIEMLFYLFVPVFFKYIKNKKNAIIATVLATLISSIYVKNMLTLNPIGNIDLWKYFLYKNLIFQLPVFMSGFILYYLIFPQKEIISEKINKLIIPIVLIILIAPNLILFNKYSIIGIIFVLLCYLVYKYPLKIIVNKYTCHLGKISFGIYLLHLYAMQLALKIISMFNIENNTLLFYNTYFIVSIIIVIIISSLAYKLIEEPSIYLGKKIIKRYAK